MEIKFVNKRLSREIPSDFHLVTDCELPTDGGMVYLSLSFQEARNLMENLEFLGCTAYDHTGGTEPPISGWTFAALLTRLRKLLTGVDHVDDFGEDGGS